MTLIGSVILGAVFASGVVVGVILRDKNMVTYADLENGANYCLRFVRRIPRRRPIINIEGSTV